VFGCREGRAFAARRMTFGKHPGSCVCASRGVCSRYPKICTPSAIAKVMQDKSKMRFMGCLAGGALIGLLCRYAWTMLSASSRKSFGGAGWLWPRFNLNIANFWFCIDMAIPPLFSLSRCLPLGGQFIPRRGRFSPIFWIPIRSYRLW